MKRSRELAYCGLACCVCGESDNCPGCRKEGCTGKDWCKSFRCCREKGISGCWECAEYPCENPMLHKPRVKVFTKYILNHGEKALMDLLERNEQAGIRYHYQGQLVGDYDQPESENEILELLVHGRP